MITVTDEMANAFLVGQGWGCKCDTCVEAAKRGLEAALASPVGQNFAETLNFYISDSENGISYVPRQKLIEIQDAIRALSAAPASPANGKIAEGETLRLHKLPVEFRVLALNDRTSKEGDHG